MRLCIVGGDILQCTDLLLGIPTKGRVVVEICVGETASRLSPAARGDSQTSYMDAIFFSLSRLLELRKTRIELKIANHMIILNQFRLPLILLQ